MHLNRAQANRFYRLFEALISYTNLKFDIVDRTLIPGKVNASPSEINELVEKLWSDDSIFSNFVEENIFSLPKVDLKTIEEWAKYHVTGPFILTSHTPRHSIVITDEFAFGIIGISDSIRNVVPDVPKIVYTTLLPFEGHIVYDSQFSSFPVVYSPNIQEMFDEFYRDAYSKHGLLVTADDLMKAVPQIKKARVEQEQDKLIDQFLSERDAGIPKVYEGVHRGALADLSGEEREQKASAALKELFRKSGFSRLSFLTESAFKQPPCYTLAEILSLLSKERLLDIARAVNAKKFSKLRKSELVELLADHLNEVAVEVLETVLLKGTDASRSFVKVLAANDGTISIAASDLSDDVPEEKRPKILEPFSPFVNLFLENETFTYVLPRELIDAYPLIDMEKIEQEIQLTDTILTSACFFTEVCGLIPVDDLYRWLVDNAMPDLDELTYYKIILRTVISGDADFEFYYPEDSDLECLAHYTLIEDVYDFDSEMTEEDFEFYKDFRKYLGKRHSQIPRKPFAAEEVLNDDPYELYLLNPHTVALCNLLDAHVPDDKHDYAFADRVLEELYDLVQWGTSTKSLIEFFQEQGLPEELIFTQGFLDVTTNLLNNVPHWANNGWTPAELMRQTSKKGKGKGRSHAPFELIDGGLSGGFEDGFGEDIDNQYHDWFDDFGDKVKREPVVVEKIGRNEPCPCGSGKKYKNCCGRA